MKPRFLDSDGLPRQAGCIPQTYPKVNSAPGSLPAPPRQSCGLLQRANSGQGLGTGPDISITMDPCPWPEEPSWETALRLAGCF
ncbi:hypothetical protein LEMLEM_LOCUS8554 [Lemmus lemmus]